MDKNNFKIYLTPDDFEKEFGMTKSNQGKYRMEDESRMKYFKKFVPRLPYILLGNKIYYEREKIQEWLEFFRKGE